MGKEADLSQPAKAPTHTGDHGGATSPLSSPRHWEGAGKAWWEETFTQPSPLQHHQHYNPGEGGGRGLGGGWGKGVPCGSGSQTAGKSSSGGSLPQSQDCNTNSACRRKEGRAWGWQLALPSSFWDQHVSRLTFAKATVDLLGFWPPQCWDSGAAQDQPLWRC